MKNHLLLAALLCSACNVSVTDANESQPAGNAAQPGNDVAAQAVAKKAAYDFKVVQEQNPQQPNRILMAQVALDRWGFSPGVLDGKDGMSYKAALRGFQQAHDLPVTGEFDQKTANMLLEGEARP
ncbi:MAG: peptidoglycan-binding domain-containing protein, partial [Pseudomonadota bacterium]